MRGEVKGSADIVQAPQDHIEGGGKAWDTVKPLTPVVPDLSRAVLIDDDAFKARPAPYSPRATMRLATCMPSGAHPILHHCGLCSAARPDDLLSSQIVPG